MARTSTLLRRSGAGLALGLAATAVLGTSAAASAASTLPIFPIHKVPCTATTFTVHYDGNARRECLEGIGTIRVAIPDVSRVTAGANSGRFIVRERIIERVVPFRPGQVIRLPGLSTMVSVTITRI